MQLLTFYIPEKDPEGNVTKNFGTCTITLPLPFFIDKVFGTGPQVGRA